MGGNSDGTAGYLDSSIFFAARCESHKVILLNGSKIESAIVAKREYDKEVVAPYVCKIARITLKMKLPRTAILTCYQNPTQTRESQLERQQR